MWQPALAPRGPPGTLRATVSHQAETTAIYMAFLRDILPEDGIFIHQANDFKSVHFL